MSFKTAHYRMDSTSLREIQSAWRYFFEKYISGTKEVSSRVLIPVTVYDGNETAFYQLELCSNFLSYSYVIVLLSVHYCRNPTFVSPLITAYPLLSKKSFVRVVGTYDDVNHDLNWVSNMVSRHLHIGENIISTT